MVAFLGFGATVSSRSTGTAGGCGCTSVLQDHFEGEDVPVSEFVTSIRNGHGPCTCRTLKPEANKFNAAVDQLWQNKIHPPVCMRAGFSGPIILCGLITGVGRHVSTGPADNIITVPPSIGEPTTYTQEEHETTNPGMVSSTTATNATHHLCLDCRAGGPGRISSQGRLAKRETPAHTSCG